MQTLSHQQMAMSKELMIMRLWDAMILVMQHGKSYAGGVNGMGKLEIVQKVSIKTLCDTQFYSLNAKRTRNKN